MPINVTLENDVRLAWPTPIFDRKWPETDELNAGLRRIILEKEKIDAGVSKSIRGGWHSTEDLFKWPHPEITQFTELMVTGITLMTEITSGVSAEKFDGRATYTAWANVLRDGGYNKPHTHPGCTWSGVYYVDAGQPSDQSTKEGWIEFFDPRPAVEMIPLPGNEFGQRVSVAPESGRMLMFPSWLRHYVTPYHGSGERISIAFNVRMEEFTPFS